MSEYEVAYAVSSRAKSCQQNIMKDNVRFGTEVEGGDFTWTAWRHLQCVPPRFWKKAVAEGGGAVEGIKGYGDLEPQDQAEVRSVYEETRGRLPPPNKAGKKTKKEAAPETPAKEKKRGWEGSEGEGGDEEGQQDRKRTKAEGEEGETTSEEEWSEEELGGELSEESD